MRVSLLLALCSGAVALVAPLGASAQVRPAGAISGHGLFSFRSTDEGTDEGQGGALVADLAFPLGAFHLGGGLGVGAISSEVDDASRVFMPITVTLAGVFRVNDVWIDVRGRAGMWAGATNQGLGVGGFFSAGAFLGYSLGEEVGLGIAFDAMFLLGYGDTIALAPGLRLVWAPSEEP